MSCISPRAIVTNVNFDAEIFLPPSKSYTNRALICAALAEGTSELLNPSHSGDTVLMIDALRRFGIGIEEGDDRLIVHGGGGRLRAPAGTLNLGNAGTTIRFLAGLAGLADGTTTLTGDERMRQRPIGELIDALAAAGVESSSENGSPPVVIKGGGFRGGGIDLDAHRSSQFLSSLLLVSPYALTPVQIRLAEHPASLPYVDLTLEVMKSFGASVSAVSRREFWVDNTFRYSARSFRIEPDASSASYFAAAAAITGGQVRIRGCPDRSLQGDFGFLDILRTMGAKITWVNETITVRGGVLRGVDVDMNGLPDCVPTLAVTAAFAEGPTTIRRVGHLKYKESDRLQAIASELEKIGASVRIGEETLQITPGASRGGLVETYRDHRIAMSFAVAGLRVPGIQIADPGCVTKSFPGFWEEFRKLEGQ